MLRPFAIAFLLALPLISPTSTFALDANAINTAEVGKKPSKATSGPDPLLIKAQVLLDRARFSPGEIDGRQGDNFRRRSPPSKARRVCRRIPNSMLRHGRN